MKNITIQPGRNGFQIKCYETKDYWPEIDCKPHYCGIYSFREDLKEKTAFNRLKRVMIKDKEERIEELKQEIKELKGLKYENN